MALDEQFRKAEQAADHPAGAGGLPVAVRVLDHLVYSQLYDYPYIVYYFHYNYRPVCVYVLWGGMRVLNNRNLLQVQHGTEELLQTPGYSLRKDPVCDLQ